MTDFNPANDTPDWYNQILGHFGVESVDCSFEELKNCARLLTAAKPDQVVKRWHTGIIQNLVKHGDSLIDLGCGDGELLAHLAYTCNCWIQGIERDEAMVNRCIERGVPVCHAELIDVLDLIPDKSYTWAVLEDTIQTLTRPLETLEKMLRVANKSIVTFPNFAHWSVRFTFSVGGRMPVTKSLPYKWYNTPNIHLCSISDFLDWVKVENVHIIDSWCFTEGRIEHFDIAKGHNITAEQVMFIIEKK